MWKYTGTDRPDFADQPEDGQESVWDYPRPPVLKKEDSLVEVKYGSIVLASSTACLRLLETASPPGYYIPLADVQTKRLEPAPGRSLCEWKGAATYWKLVETENDQPIAWSYVDPIDPYSVLSDYMSFYPGRVECYVNNERARPQPGHFYGGWITDHIAGPVKGMPGTGGW